MHHSICTINANSIQQLEAHVLVRERMATLMEFSGVIQVLLEFQTSHS